MSAPSLVITCDGVTRQFDAEVTVGRDPRSTVVVADDRVSRSHARIQPHGDRWRWLDCSSRGSWSAGARITSLVIDGDASVRLGGPDGPELLLRVARPAGTAPILELSGPDGSPLARPPAADAAPILELSSPDGSPLARPPAAGAAPILELSSPDGSRLARPGEQVSVGRDPACAVHIDDPRVSRTHLVIAHRPGVGWLACDQRSTSGTFRDGTRIDQALVDGTAPVELRLADPTSGPTLTLRARAPSPLDSRLGPPAQPRPRLGSLSASRPLTSLLRIGRAPDNDVVLADDLTVSRHHAQLRRQGGQATIVDLGSRHGTYIDGARVTAAAVADGAVVRIGRHLFVARDGQLDTYVDDGAVLATTDLTVTVDGGRKTLLADITMAVQPGQLVAVIGPSGAGKTTLLRALTGVSPATGGTVTYNGRDLYASLDELRYRIGFVPQDDILHSQLTLRRALSYAAELRFADDTSRAERKARVDEVLAELGLDQRDGLQISNLSGGQRKRASVALELLTRPALLFLDEPTSGLDPGFERSVMQLLRELADGGRTVVVITHAVASLQLCDRVLVLASGSMAFFGPPGEILGFFGATDYARVFQLLEAGTADWAARFKAHAAYQAYVAGPARQHARRPGAAQAVGHVMWRGAGVARQIGTLVRRNVAVLAGTRGYAGLLLAQAPVMAGLLLLALGGGNLAGTPDSRPRNLLILLVTAAIAMGLVNACREIVRELAIYQRERTVGLSLGAYLISKFVYLGALAAAQSAVLTAVVVQGQKAGGDALVFGTPLAELGVILFAATFAAVALGLAVSARVSTDAAALVMIPVLLVAQLVLSHALIDVEGRPVLAATAWATPAYWAFSGAAASTDLISLEGRCGQTPVEGAPASAGPTCGSLWDPTTGNLMLSLAALTVLTLAYAAAAATALRHRDPIRL